MPTISLRLRAAQYVGLLMLAGSAFATTFDYHVHPQASRKLEPPVYEISAGTFVTSGTQVPTREAWAALEASRRGPQRLMPFWHLRAWYPFLLAPLWLLALVLAAPPGSRSLRLPRAGIGAFLLVLGIALALFEALYLHSDYASFLPGGLGVAEGIAAWLMVVAVLFWRRAGDRRLDAVEATIGAQALLALLHLFTLPATMARPWLVDYPTGDVARTVLANFPLAFWIGCAGAFLTALPVYVRRSAA